MGLQSTGLAIALATAAAMLLAGMLWLWPRLAVRSAGAIALRVVLVGALQVSVIGLIFTDVNRSMDFYSSWSDLLGTTTFTHLTVAARNGRGNRAGRAAAVTVLAAGPVRVPGRPHEAGGRLEAVRFHGPVSGITVRGYVYVPPRQAGAGHALPVVVVVSGVAASATAVYGAHRVAETAAIQIGSGRMPSAIIAVLNPAVTARSGQACLNVPGGPQVDTFFSQDLPYALERSFRATTAASGWAVAGVAGGGYCALQVATAPSDPFSIVAAPPGSYTAPPGGDLIPSGTAPPARLGVQAGLALRRQDDVVWRLRNRPPPPIRVLFAGAGPAGPIVSLARPPMSVTVASLAPTPWPLTPVFSWIGRDLRSAGRSRS